MSEQIGNPVNFFFPFTASKAAKTGLNDLSVDVDETLPDGTVTSLVTGASITHECRHGIYLYRMANAAVEADYVAVATTADGTVDLKTVPALQQVGHGGIEHLNADISTAVADAVAILAKLPVATDLLATHADVLSLTGGGGGTEPYVHAVHTPGGDPIANVIVWVTALNHPGAQTLQSGITDDLGEIEVQLTPGGPYYFWHKHATWNFPDDPAVESVP